MTTRWRWRTCRAGGGGGGRRARRGAEPPAAPLPCGTRRRRTDTAVGREGGGGGRCASPWRVAGGAAGWAADGGDDRGGWRCPVRLLCFVLFFGAVVRAGWCGWIVWVMAPHRPRRCNLRAVDYGLVSLALSRLLYFSFILCASQPTNIHSVLTPAHVDGHTPFLPAAVTSHTHAAPWARWSGGGAVAPAWPAVPTPLAPPLSPRRPAG